MLVVSDQPKCFQSDIMHAYANISDVQDIVVADYIRKVCCVVVCLFVRSTEGPMTTFKGSSCIIFIGKDMTPTTED